MSLPALPLALAALLPAMLGPLPGAGHAGPAALTAQLCNGGTISIPLHRREAPAAPSGCHPKGCHAGTCREREKEEI